MNIVFDVGNVLLRWSPEDLVASQLSGVDAAAVAARVFAEPHWHALDRGTADRAEVEQAARRSSGLSSTAIRRLFDAVPAALEPIAPMVDLLRALREEGVPTYVLSNMPAYIQDEIVRQHDFFADFNGLVFSNRVRLIKPEAGIYQLLLDHHQLAADQCLFIDDLPHNLAAAEALGLHTLHLPANADTVTCERVGAAVWRWLDGRPKT